MIELGLRYGQGAVPLNVIAEAQGVSENYVEQFMGALRRAGLVASTRGPEGGYELTRAPGQIRISEVVQALDGPLVPVECLEESLAGKARAKCERSGTCAAQLLWKRLRDSMVCVLDSTTLDDMCEDARELTSQVKTPMYHI